jgi:hypothetical protein
MRSYVVTSPGNMANTLKHHSVHGKVPSEHQWLMFICIVVHVQIFVMNTVNPSTRYSYFCYLMNTLSLVHSKDIAYVFGVFIICESRHWYGHYKNVYATRKLAFSSLLLHHMLLQAFIMYLWKQFLEQNAKFTYSVAEVFKGDEPAVHRNKQTADNDINA